MPLGPRLCPWTLARVLLAFGRVFGPLTGLLSTSTDSSSLYVCFAENDLGLVFFNDFDCQWKGRVRATKRFDLTGQSGRGLADLRMLVLDEV